MLYMTMFYLQFLVVLAFSQCYLFLEKQKQKQS